MTVLCLALSGLTSAGSLRADLIRILPLGDSITQGGRREREEYTYRFALFKMLRDAKVNFDFIGSEQKGLHPDAKWPTYKDEAFDLDHEGHYGWKTGQVRDHLREWMPKWQGAPDIVLIHLGTNDQKSSDYQKDIIQPLAEIIAMLREKNPRVVVLVGHLAFNDGAALQIRPLVEEMAKDLNTAQSPVATVHHYRGWHEKPTDADADTFDWAHPNPRGQEKMAANWFEAMKPFFQLKTSTGQAKP